MLEQICLRFNVVNIVFLTKKDVINETHGYNINNYYLVI